MNKKLIQNLREITFASMNDCISALKEANDNLQKAIDIIKARGKNIVSGREGKIASEGILVHHYTDHNSGFGHDLWICLEVNSQTDFVSKMPEFQEFAVNVIEHLIDCVEGGAHFTLTTELEETRKDLIAKTKENIVVRRHWVERAAENEKAFVYRHSNKLEACVVLSGTNLDTEEVEKLGNDLCLQVAAMNPLVIDTNSLTVERNDDLVIRQIEIFKEQIAAMNKPESAHQGIMNGKMRKWAEEIVLLEQESITAPKKKVKDLIPANITIKKFIRAQVGEGIEKPTEDFANEVAKMTETP